ncbi:MAG: DUF6998 domain-containing protein [Alphaproteobacteria bacterium]
MTYDVIKKEELESIIPTLKRIYKETEKMSKAIRDMKFTVDGHLLGSVGACIASYMFDLKLNKGNSNAGFDALTKDNQKVEIKIRKAARNVSISKASKSRVEVDKEELYLIALEMNDNFEISIIYSGLLTEDVLKQFNKNLTIAFSKLKSCQKDGDKSLSCGNRLAEINKLIAAS